MCVGSRFPINQSATCANEVRIGTSNFCQAISACSVNQKNRHARADFRSWCIRPSRELLYRPPEKISINWTDKLKLVAIIDPIFWHCSTANKSRGFWLRAATPIKLPRRCDVITRRIFHHSVVTRSCVEKGNYFPPGGEKKKSLRCRKLLKNFRDRRKERGTAVFRYSLCESEREFGKSSSSLFYRALTASYARSFSNGGKIKHSRFHQM